MSQNPVSCQFANETKSQRLENYGFKASLLRFVQIHQICAENRPKSRGRIWKRRKKVVTLHCQSEDNARSQDERHKSGRRRADVDRRK